MVEMFSGAYAFNQDISNWDVSSVTTMVEMFSGAYAFNQDISNWDVSSVTTMVEMFYEARGFNQVLCWDVVGKSRLDMFDGSSGAIGSTSACVPGDDDDSSPNDDDDGDSGSAGGSESQSSVDGGHVLAGSIGAVVAVCIGAGWSFAVTAHKKCLAEGKYESALALLQLGGEESRMIEQEVELPSRSAI
jgi:surface protein